MATALNGSNNSVLAAEAVPYLSRSHGPHYTPAAMQALEGRGPVDLGPPSRWHPPVPACAGIDCRVLDFSNGVEASGYIDGEVAVGKWCEVRDGMYDLPSQASDARSLHMGKPGNGGVLALAPCVCFMTDCTAL
jgi:hypothetical protein